MNKVMEHAKALVEHAQFLKAQRDMRPKPTKPAFYPPPKPPIGPAWTHHLEDFNRWADAHWPKHVAFRAAYLESVDVAMKDDRDADVFEDTWLSRLEPDYQSYEHMPLGRTVAATWCMYTTCGLELLADTGLTRDGFHVEGVRLLCEQAKEDLLEVYPVGAPMRMYWRHRPDVSVDDIESNWLSNNTSVMLYIRLQLEGHNWPGNKAEGACAQHLRCAYSKEAGLHRLQQK